MAPRPFSTMLALIASFPLVADADQLCRSKGGVLKSRPSCRGKETVVNPSDLGLAGPKGDKGPKGDAGETGPSWHIVDAYGTDVGTVVHVYDSGDVRVVTELVLPDKDQKPEPVQLVVKPTGYNGYDTLPDYSTFLYLDTACAGPQYMPGVPQFAPELKFIFQPQFFLGAFFYSRSSELVTTQFQQRVARPGDSADCALHDDGHGPGTKIKTDGCIYWDAGDGTCTICCQPIWGPDPDTAVPGPLQSTAAPAHLFNTGPWQPPFALKRR
jgi:hypothetical protein